MELSRQGRPWEGEVPRNCGPVDPVERPAMYRKGEGRRQGEREALLCIWRRSCVMMRRMVKNVPRALRKSKNELMQMNKHTEREGEGGR